MSNIYFLVVAGGAGSRLGSDIPKQFLTLQNRSVLSWSAEKLCRVDEVKGGVVVLPKAYLDLELPLYEDKWIQTCEGGSERVASVCNGLALLADQVEPDAWVLVHDAARPCVRPTCIQRLIDEVISKEAIGGLLGKPVRDTLKRSNSEGFSVSTVSRDSLWQAFTPQLFPISKLSEALRLLEEDWSQITDEASAFERLGYQPLLVEGASDNIKITYTGDIEIADAILRSQDKVS